MPTPSEHFNQVYSREPDLLARAPGRVNLIGEHVDYQDGIVLPAAIDRHVYSAARRIEEPVVRLWSALNPERPPLEVPTSRQQALEGDGAWANYAFGVAMHYRAAGHFSGGFEIAFAADLPLGAGVSSSAALESATALAIEGMAGITLPPAERALLCQAAEHDWAGVPCGIMDQLAVNCGIAGHLLEIDCRTLDLQPLKLPDGLSIVLVDSKVRHALADGEYAARRADCEAACAALDIATLRDASMSSIEKLRDAGFPPHLYCRARHVVSEIGRVREFITAISEGNIAGLATIMAASHASLRDDYEVSCRELDQLVAIASGLGSAGSRLMGGGFGGSTVNLFPSTEATQRAGEIVALALEAHGLEVEAFVVNPADGGRIVSP